MFKMHGIVPPMVTPFKENGDLDTDQLKALVAFLTPRVNGLFVTGSYGSGALMSLDERKRLTEITLETAAGRIPVIPMVGTTNTRDSIELALHAQSAGAQAVAAVGPYYYKHDEDALIGFYTDIIEKARIPVYLYNNTSFQGYPIGIGTIQKLKSRGLSGIKDATFDIITHASYQRLLKDETFDVALGTEAIFASARVLGCESFIPGLGNAFPEICAQMFGEGMAGDYAACARTQFRINEIREIMYLARSTQLAVYAMMEIRGIIRAYPRKPFIPASDAEKAAIKAGLVRLGML